MNRQFKGDSLLTTPSKYIVVDIETTGFNPGFDHIIEIGALTIDNDSVISEFHSMVNPGVPIPDHISNLTGITGSDVESAPNINTVLPIFLEYIGSEILVAHNAHFDINFLYDNCITCLDRPLSNDFIDTLKLSRKIIHDIDNYKLSTLAKKLNIHYDSLHRSLSDCYITKQLLSSLRKIQTDQAEQQMETIRHLNLSQNSPFLHQRVAWKGSPSSFDFEFILKLGTRACKRFGNIFYSNTDILVLGKRMYERYCSDNLSEKLSKYKELSIAGALTVISEYDFYESLKIPYTKHTPSSSRSVNIDSIVSEYTDFDESHPLYQKVCVFTGALDKMSRKNAMQAVVNIGGLLGKGVTKETNYLILGNNDYCTNIKDGKSAKQKKAEKYTSEGMDIKIITEDTFYDLLDAES